MVFLIKLLVFFIKNMIAIGKLGGTEGIDEYLASLEQLLSGFAGGEDDAPEGADA